MGRGLVASGGHAGAERGPLARALPQMSPPPADHPAGAGQACRTGSPRFSVWAGGFPHPHALPGEEDA